MDEVTDTKVYEYQSEVTVEVMGMDSEGEFDIVSYHFDLDDDATTVQYRGEIDPVYRSNVEDALTTSGYRLG